MPSLGEACCGRELVCGYLVWNCFLLVGMVVSPFILLRTPSSVETYPLWTGSTAVDAAVVVVRFGDFAQFRASLWIDLPHFTHVGETVVYTELYGCRWAVGERERSAWAWRSGDGP
jgi:hypothetical protein